MKVITIWQPWATLIMAGVKPYEFRGWRPPRSMWGSRIGIHAGARPVRKAEVAELITRLMSRELAWTTALKPEALPILAKAHLQPAYLPLSSILGTAVLGQPRIGLDIARREFGCKVNDSDRDQHSNWAWPLMYIESLEPFVPARGKQGFWDWKPDPVPTAR